jgi:hypothetical protein
LKDAMQLMQGKLLRHANQAPDWRSDFRHRYLQ